MAWRWTKTTLLSLQLALLLGVAIAAEGGERMARACGRELPLEISRDGEFDPSGPGSLAAIRDSSLPALVRELDAVCRASPRHRTLYAREVARIRFARAQGATEPTAYLDGRTLVIEFFGGPYDAAPFRRDLRRALERRPADND